MAKQEITRLCDRCQAPITRADEERGSCPVCQGVLLSLADYDRDYDPAFNDALHMGAEFYEAEEETDE